MTVSKLEELAYGHATAQILSDLGGNENWYSAYQYLTECMENGSEPDGLVVWQPFEYWEWRDIAEQIESEAMSLLSSYKRVLEYAKNGIIEAAIDCTLDSDMNQLDMVHLVESGVHREAETSHLCNHDKPKNQGRKVNRQKAVFKLRDGDAYDDKTKEVKVTVHSSEVGLEVRIDGYSDCSSNDSEGAPIYLEKYEDEMFLRVFSDINCEEPTHSISLNGARNTKRIDVTSPN